MINLFLFPSHLIPVFKVQQAASGSIFNEMPDVRINVAHMHFAHGDFPLAVKMVLYRMASYLIHLNIFSLFKHLTQCTCWWHFLFAVSKLFAEVLL